MSTAAFIDKTFTAPAARCRNFTEVVRQYVPTSRPCRILDVGCGSGGQLFDLAETLPTATLVGVDVSQLNIHMAE